MKLITLLAASLLITLSCSHKEKKPKEHEVMKNTVEETAEVTSIDYKTRKMSLRTEDGPVTITAPAEVQNFNQIEKGDTVVAQYEEALVYTISDKGEAEAAKVDNSNWIGRAGERPEAGTQTAMTASLEVTGVDKKEPSVTLKNSAGEEQKFKVKHPERLKEVDVGDIVNVKYSEALAVKVEKKNRI